MSGIAPVTKAGQKEKTASYVNAIAAGESPEVDEVFPLAASGVEFFLLFSSFFLEKIRIHRNNRAAAGRRIKKDDIAGANPCP